jgi:hypothetical protein
MCLNLLKLSLSLYYLELIVETFNTTITNTMLEVGGNFTNQLIKE